MRLVRFALISIVVLFSIATLMGLLFPSVVIVSRAIDVNAPKDSVEVLVKDLNGWKQWMAIINSPSTQIISATEANVGDTKVSINNHNADTIASTWLSKNGKLQTSLIRVFAHPSNNVTTVQWQFQEHLHWYPWERMGSMFNENILGPLLESNLNKLKELVEEH